MAPPAPGVSLPGLGLPALPLPSPAARSLPPPRARGFLPPIAPAPAPSARSPQRTQPRAQGRDKDTGRPPAMAGQGESPPAPPGWRGGVSVPHGHPQRPFSSRPTELPSPCTIRLDRENISAIRRLRSRRDTHSLYLQQNQIEKIENLSCFPNLRFLSLAGNRIRRVENLQPLQHLSVLDLSHNRIQTLEPAELPRSLRLLDLTGNECTHQQGYRELVVAALPHLLQLDAQPVHGTVDEEEEEGGSCSSEDEDDEVLSVPSSPFTAGKDFFVDLQRELAGHSQRRRREALEEHQTRLERLEELREHRDLLLLPLNPPGSGAPRPRRLQPRPQVKLGTPLPLLPPRAPSSSQPHNKALQEDTCAKGARNKQLPPIARSSTAPCSWD
ncbi:leucine-rich repeat-containing protein 46 [Strigops habroptila]|uniref:leucine-rich repeat-containing protein 46 n=1 Tax=Strigops habroptila TaxID=2489341 RepID=UPI0011CEF1A9|nr:leucine-rich repeat-containing protein 46 [Strigops habroptila]